ncbi:MAG TPA: hypothetical protein VIQ81_12245 [Gammaproteobacteria bacterium]
MTEKHFVKINLNSLIYLHDRIVWVVSPLWRLPSLSTATKKEARKRRPGTQAFIFKQQKIKVPSSLPIFVAAADKFARSKFEQAPPGPKGEHHG